MRIAARHVVWDWNGTLLDDTHVAIESINAVCRSYGRPEITLRAWHALPRHRRLLDCYSQVLGVPLQPQDWYDIYAVYRERYVALLADCRLAAGVPELLRSRSDLTQSLLSMSPHDHLLELVDTHGLTGVFTRVDGLLHDDDVPKTEHLAEHLRAQDLDPGDVVVIGDTIGDAEAAQALECSAVLVTTGLCSRAALEITGFPVADSVAEALSRLTTTADAGR